MICHRGNALYYYNKNSNANVVFIILVLSLIGSCIQKSAGFSCSFQRSPNSFSLLRTQHNNILLYNDDNNNGVVLYMAKSKRGGISGGNKKGNSGLTKKTKHKKGNKKDKKMNDNNNNVNQWSSSDKKKKSNNGVAIPTASGSSGSSRSPPWQVMSKKDVQKNIEGEKKRRLAIQTGQASSSMMMEDDEKTTLNTKSRLLSASDRSLFRWKRFRPDTAIGGMSFIGAYLDRQLPPSLGVPEVAFLGRSNVGKSSLLNCLSNVGKVGNTDGARVGKTPGATASVNMYALLHNSKKSGGDGSQSKPIFGFVDLPGFGYAKLSKSVKASVEMAAETYLGKRKELAIGILLVDIRRTPSEDDRAVLAALYDLGLPIMVVATKIDKIDSANALEQARAKIRDGLGLPDGQPFCVSSETGQGKKELWQIILDASEDHVQELMDGNNADKDDEDDSWDTDDDSDKDADGELEYDQGYDWIQSFGEGDDLNDGNDKSDKDDGYDQYDNDDDDGKYYSEEPTEEMKVNEENQAADKEAMQLKNLKRRVRQMEREGEL